MAILQVRDIDEGTYTMLREMAQRNKRSISQEVIMILEAYLQNPQRERINATSEFLNLRWKDNRSADEIIASIKSDRNNSSRFEGKNGIFD